MKEAAFRRPCRRTPPKGTKNSRYLTMAKKETKKTKVGAGDSIMEWLAKNPSLHVENDIVMTDEAETKSAKAKASKAKKTEKADKVEKAEKPAKAVKAEKTEKPAKKTAVKKAEKVVAEPAAEAVEEKKPAKKATKKAVAKVAIFVFLIVVLTFATLFTAEIQAFAEGDLEYSFTVDSDWKYEFYDFEPTFSVGTFYGKNAARYALLGDKEENKYREAY